MRTKNAKLLALQETDDNLVTAVEPLPVEDRYVAYEAFTAAFDDLAQPYAACNEQTENKALNESLQKVIGNVEAIRNDIEVGLTRISPAPRVSSTLRADLRKKHGLDHIWQVDEEIDIDEDLKELTLEASLEAEAAVEDSKPELIEGKPVAQVFKRKEQSRLSAADAKEQGIALHHADASPEIVTWLKRFKRMYRIAG